jgi:hypothetical protein
MREEESNDKIDRIHSSEKRNDKRLNIEKYATLVLPHQRETSTWLAWSYDAPVNKFRDPRM